MKYRIVQTPTGYAVQAKVFLFWSYLENAWGVPPAFKTAEEAECALQTLLGKTNGGVRVVKEIVA